MKSSDLQPGMDVAVYTGTGHPELNMMCAKARVIESGVPTNRGYTYRQKRKDGTLLHYYGRLPSEGLTSREAYAPGRFTELLPFDPEAKSPLRDEDKRTEIEAILKGRRRYDESITEEESQAVFEIEARYSAASSRANSLRRAQRTIPNREILMPWDEYVAWRTEESIVQARRDEQHRIAREKQDAEDAELERRIKAVDPEGVLFHKERWGNWEIKNLNALLGRLEG